jgi:hypothetical protein
MPHDCQIMAADNQIMPRDYQIMSPGNQIMAHDCQIIAADNQIMAHDFQIMSARGQIMPPHANIASTKVINYNHLTPHHQSVARLNAVLQLKKLNSYCILLTLDGFLQLPTQGTLGNLGTLGTHPLYLFFSGKDGIGGNASGFFISFKKGININVKMVKYHSNK